MRILLALALLLSVGCSTSTHEASTLARLGEGYRRGVALARDPSLPRSPRPLTPIRDSNRALVWSRSPDGRRRVLLASFTGWAGFKPLVGTITPLQREMWVTVAPELAELCRTFEQTPEALTQRLDEVLGMPPTKPYPWIVEVAAEPRDVFRPCADPRIDSTECPRELAADAPANHRKWFAHQAESSAGAEGYPWTRAGYTYDWKQSPPGNFGLSEYVVRQGASVEVRRVVETREYCRPTPAR